MTCPRTLLRFEPTEDNKVGREGAFRRVADAPLRASPRPRPFDRRFSGPRTRSFAGQYADRLSPSAHVIIRLGKHAGLVEQLTLIEGKATALREKAAQGRFGLTWPGRAEHAGTAGD